ncbi:MAG: glycoside hydrolase family 88 protein [Carboxylicivirga sp.]|jgi:rhamnogalacturonyl hydrolase YesR|nr:glycoside hydrolase family 88 protein [Carboxylicivirga sp.]
MTKISCTLLLALLILSGGCFNTIDSEKDFVTKQFSKVESQYDLLLDDAIKYDKNPRTIDENGHTHWATRDNGGFDWTLGFFPGSCWYLYEQTKSVKWKEAAEYFQNMHKDFKSKNISHDLGFIFACSYGNGYRLTKNEEYKQVMIEAGNSLLQRFNPTVGCIQSWNITGGWQARRGWRFPVIIDNMMNLELLFELSVLTGDSKYKDAAIAHANVTLDNHFRLDNSSYHVVDYNPETGKVRHKHTAQGYAHESSWARGQAWGLYGYTVCYRYTNDERYLKIACSIADYILNNKSIPSDLIPYWDYHAPKIPNEPRDASAAAITASALLELDLFTNGRYKDSAKTILKSLASDAYTAKIGENNHFVLMHSVGSIPHNNEIDVPLNYADYYYLEALVRLSKSEI